MRKSILRSVIVFFSIALYVVPNVFAEGAEISGIWGNVEYVKDGSMEWKPAYAGAILAPGDKIRSKEDSWAEITFEEKHVVKLGVNSLLVIKKAGIQKELNLIKGKLISKVRKLSRNESFKVRTPQAVAAVRGTYFTVIVGEIGEDTQIIVHKGSVLSRELITGEEVIVPAGKFTIIIKDKAPTKPDKIENLRNRIKVLRKKITRKKEKKEKAKDVEKKKVEKEAETGIEEDIVIEEEPEAEVIEENEASPYQP